MSDIKVIKGLEPWEVMKRAGDGEPVAIRQRYSNGDWRLYSHKGFDFIHFEFAIIDTTTPSIDWDGFNWDFFNQYGGLRCNYDDGKRSISIKETPADPEDLAIVKSPSYYWPGGEQPVPDNVEIETVWRDGSTMTEKASDFEWAHFRSGRCMGDTIAFKLTGRVCDG